MTLPERFWSKVDKRGPNDCWEWKAGRHTQGYGLFWFEGTTHRAHRLVMGEPKLHVLHTCDNPPCCNPNHLFLGTDADNMEDKVLKGRARGGGPKGEGDPNSKLTNEDVRFIRTRYAKGGITYRQLAARFGVHHSVIYKVITKQTWKNVT